MTLTCPSFEDLSGEAQPFDERRAEQEIHRAVNQVRAAHGLESLVFNADVATVARRHCRDMAAQGYVGHQSPAGDSVRDRLEAYRASLGDSAYHYSACGENIARNHYDSRVVLDDGTVVKYQSLWEFSHGVVHGWMQSLGHRENILTDSWSTEGIGVLNPRDSLVLVTQVFTDSAN